MLFRFFRILALAVPALAVRGEEIDFNRQIRPILSDKCYACHGPDVATRKTKLRFDLEESAKAALANGKLAIVASHPEQSEVISRVTSPDKALRMPPAYMGKDPLTAKEIELLREWISQGAKWLPFWSFVPPVKAPVPPGENAIDYFIDQRLRQEGIERAPQADRGTLLRRVSLDLTGIPPSPADLSAFLNDSSADAYGKAVDRLLASPRYAERMAFRWMEAARYGDTNGYQTDGPRDMYRWRDWVIEAYRSNMPYDRFAAQQIAGDLMPHATRDQMIATGFNRNHRTTGEGGIIPEEYRVEYVADRVQTTSTVFLGLTVGCARCHDHKYDPISQRDFYRMFAYFNQVPDEKGFVWNYGNEEPLVKAPTADQERKLAALDRKLADAKEAWLSHSAEVAKAASVWRPKPGSHWTVTRGLVFSNASERVFDGTTFFEQKDGKAVDFDYLQPFTYAIWIKPSSLNGGIFSHSDDYLEGSGHGIYLIDGKVRFHLIHRWTDLGIRKETKARVRLNEWQQITVTYDGHRKAAGLQIYIDGVPQESDALFDQNNEPLHVPNRPIRIGAAGGMKFTGAIRDARIYNVALEPEEVEAISAPPSDGGSPLQGPLQEKRLELAYLDQAAPSNIRIARESYRRAAEERQNFYESVPSVMVMRDGANRDSFLLKRGAYDAPGEKLTAAIPSIFGKLDSPLPPNRLGLAMWISDRRNPLTARVAVNRFWQSFFGYGIVKTVDDFGSQGEWPVHPELLDWLAAEFMDSGWDVKHILKTIVMSGAYQQSSRSTPELLSKDPDNRLLARGPRYRLGPEVIRDQALAVSGLLVEKVGGPSVKPYQPPGLWQELAGGKGYQQDSGEGLYRRSLYTYWKRTAAPPYMTNFDSPNREVCTVWENRTNSPLQALNLMNDVTFLESSRKLAERLMVEGGREPAARIDYAFHLLLARPVDADRLPILTSALARFESGFRKHPEAARQLVIQGDSPVRKDLDMAEWAAWTSLSSILLNMDEVISKQ